MTTLHKSEKETLQRLVDQIERLEAEKSGIADDVRDKYAEAKAMGFDVKIIRQVIKLRKVDKADRDEAQALLDVYMNALGMLADTPLGQAAMDRATMVHAIAKAHGIPKHIADHVAADA